MREAATVAITHTSTWGLYVSSQEGEGMKRWSVHRPSCPSMSSMERVLIATELIQRPRIHFSIQIPSPQKLFSHMTSNP